MQSLHRAAQKLTHNDNETVTTTKLWTHFTTLRAKRAMRALETQNSRFLRNVVKRIEFEIRGGGQKKRRLMEKRFSRQ